MAKTAKTTAIRTGEASPPLLFRHVSPGPDDSTLKFRLLHFWEARKNVKGGPGILLGIEMFMIDAELVDGQALHQHPVLCTNDNSASRKVMVHLQLKDGPVMNVYLWDEAAESFRIKFDASAVTPIVLLVTTVNPKRLGGKLCLSSMSSSRVFLDEEVDPTKEYLAWLTTNPSVTSLVNSVEVVKAGTLTIGEIAAFLKRQPAQVAYFDCIATIDDVKLGTEWYYIACKDCQTNYRVELSVYDNDEQCTFIILGDAGKDLTGRKATELIDAYIQENGGDAAELEVPLPQCFIDTIGQTKKFRIKVAHYNFTSTRLSLTATKIVSPAELPPKNPPLKTPPELKWRTQSWLRVVVVVLQLLTTRRKQSVPSVVARSHAEWSLHQ
uniref:Replication factor A C-terminal domain-containing protein n=1 Tax=Brassica oleracea var. oleracea TaxID=109376 RepID=A0A0D3D8B1_BRAOL